MINNEIQEIQEIKWRFLSNDCVEIIEEYIKPVKGENSKTNKQDWFADKKLF